MIAPSPPTLRRHAPAAALALALAVAALGAGPAGAALRTGAVPAPAASPWAAEPDTAQPVPTAVTAADSALADSASTELRFRTLEGDTLGAAGQDHALHLDQDEVWLRAPFGDNLLTDPDEWRGRGRGGAHTSLHVDYNRVDRWRLGFTQQLQRPETLLPRIGWRLEYAFQRKVALYGLQLEQPLLPPGRLALGVSMTRRTDHFELQQVPDWENAIDLIIVRQDFRDYFDREGYGAYLSWRVPDFSTVSVHFRNDDYRSLEKRAKVWTIGFPNRELRENPEIDEGNMRSVILRLERLARQTGRSRGGLYHWIQLERAGHGMGGDFDFTRGLADVRSVIRLAPGTTLALRGVLGTTLDGVLPLQRAFTLGGPDGLRAHPFNAYVGDQIALAQAQYSLGLWQFRGPSFDGGLRLLAFIDAGRAWSNPEGQWDADQQRYDVDGGFGLATSDDNLNLTFAKQLDEPSSDFVVSLRFQRPF